MHGKLSKFTFQTPEVLNEVRGVRWGVYAGSPADERPIIALVQPLRSQVSSMAELSTSELLLLPQKTSVYVTKSEKGKYI